MTRVLVVEDSPTQAQSLALLLQSEGFEVELARDGESGFERCKSFVPDAVLSDVVMPGMDGYDLCRKIKSDAATSGIPVILLTSLADPMDIVRGLECGADNFLRKPYDAQDLLTRLQRLLQNRAHRGHRRLSVGVEVLIMGKKFTVNSEKEQMLDLFISTFEEVMRSREREYETKLREETVRESHRFLQAALDALSAQIAIVDAAGKVIAVNAPWRRFAAAFDWPDAGVGQSYQSLWQTAFAAHSEDAPRILDGIRNVQSGEAETFAAEHTARVGKASRWFALSARRFEDRGAKLIAFEQEDITARKQLEQQFQQSQKMEAIGQLAGGVAHDFNNLLTVIGGYAEMLADSFPANDSRAGDAAEIGRACNTASALTRQLLAFSRQQSFQPKVVDLNTVVAELDKMLRRLIGEDITYSTVLDPGAGRVHADPAQLQQVLMNLVVNARDAMPLGGTLTVSTSTTHLDNQYAQLHTNVVPGRYVMLAVTDSGQGMDATTQARIFEPFFTTKGAGKGTGLGLSTVYGIVQQSGGHVWVYSEVGQGTTFKIFLPRVDAMPETESRRPMQNHRPTKASNVLVVEDNEPLRQMLCRILRSAGFGVLEAADPHRARELCDQPGATIDVLVSDVVMPHMNGVDLVSELLVTRPQLRVVLMSGHAAAPMSSQLPPNVVFLEKPFTPESVLAKVHAATE